jgi:hypothetical protein
MRFSIAISLAETALWGADVPAAVTLMNGAM